MARPTTPAPASSGATFTPISVSDVQRHEDQDEDDQHGAQHRQQGAHARRARGLRDRATARQVPRDGGVRRLPHQDRERRRSAPIEMRVPSSRAPSCRGRTRRRRSSPQTSSRKQQRDDADDAAHAPAAPAGSGWPAPPAPDSGAPGRARCGSRASIAARSPASATLATPTITSGQRRDVQQPLEAVSTSSAQTPQAASSQRMASRCQTSARRSRSERSSAARAVGLVALARAPARAAPRPPRRGSADDDDQQQRDDQQRRCS